MDATNVADDATRLTGVNGKMIGPGDSNEANVALTSGRTAAKNIPLSSVLFYAAQGKTQAEIARELGCTRSCINQKLQGIGYYPGSVDHLKSARADMLAVVGDMFLSDINPETVKKMPVRDRVWCYGVLYDKERLERGLSTQNTSEVHHLLHRVYTNRSSHQADQGPETPQIVIDNPTLEAECSPENG